MCSLPLRYGFASKRWSNAIKVMLEKDVGNPRIDCLWVIHLLEVDYNFVLKLIWGRRLIQRAAQFRTLMPAQQARPVRLATSSVFNKVLIYDLIRLIKSGAANFDNDATGCYDNIVPPHGMVC